MSGYDDGEGAILTLIRTLSNFDSDNTSQADWKIRNSGKAALENYAVLRPGPFEIEWISPTKYEGRWTTVIELWQRYKDDSTTQTNLYARMEELVDGILPEYKLGGSVAAVKDSTVRRAAEPLEIYDREGNGPFWLKWELIIEWIGEHVVTFTD